MVDAVVIGSGPNGLAGAAALARHGWSVVVLEAKARPGGALYSEPFTEPGFVHDVGAAFFPFADMSPAFRALDLTGAGLQWRNAAIESCHPAPDGTSVSIARDAERSAASFGVDGAAWRRLAEWMRDMGDGLAKALLAPLPALGPAWHLGVGNIARLSLAGLQTPAAWARRTFETEAARRVVPGLALHVDLGPEDFAGAGLGLVLALLASASGFRVPVGGARAIAEALLARLEAAGGSVLLNTRAARVLVRDGRAVAVRTDDGGEIDVRRAVLADVGAPALYLNLLDDDDVPGGIRGRMREFRYGWGTFKMDWALSGAVPWTSGEAREAAVVHAGDSIDDLIAFTNQVRAGELPANPYLVIGQQSLVDPSRAPAGCHTLWAYSRVPPRLPGGWAAQRERFADRIEERIEGLAPGFRGRILGRAIHAPPDLEAMDENLVGGDLGGGSAHFDQQLFFRPVFPYFRYRTPVAGLYLASASAHPGAGVHGACGWNAARMALADAGE
ncbi:dehydrogenase [Planctomycetaceae bacterium SCGC AG-212-D15]|nr:dehydrogenase [Planctomycetaceae bacterium SCGC AG-212-D15]